MRSQRLDLPDPAPITRTTLVPPQDAAAVADPGRRRAARRVAIGLATAGLHIGALPAAMAADPLASGRRLTFTVLCDTLVPADDLTPAASALGVPETILEDIEGVADAQSLLAAACDWLDAHASGNFAQAGEAERERVLGAMAAQPWESPVGRFFQLARNTVMAEYYAQPAAWRGLALDRPPQPLGFPDAVR